MTTRYFELLAEHEAAPVRNEHVRELSAVILECQSIMLQAGLRPTVGELIEMSRIVWTREAEARRMEFAVRERWLGEPQEETVN